MHPKVLGDATLNRKSCPVTFFCRFLRSTQTGIVSCLPYNIAAMHTAMGIINKRQLLIIAFLQLSFSILASSLDSLSLNQIKQIITSLSPMGKAWIFNEDDSCGNKKCKAPYQLCTISYIAKGSEELHYECSKVSESCLSLIRSIKKKALAAKQRDHPLRDIPVQQESEITDADESGEATSNGEKEDSSCDNSAALSISQQSFPFWGSIIIAPIAGCFNGHNMCCEWASKGECNRNPVMMKTLCKQACGTCSCQADEVLLCKPVVNAISCLPPKKTPDCKPKKPKVAQTTTALPESPAGDSEESLVVIDVEEPLIISEEVEKPTDTEQPPTESVSEEVPEEVVSQELTTVEETTSAYVTEKTETAVEEVVTTAKKEEVEEEEEQLSTETAIAVSEEEEAPSEEMKVEATEAPAEAEISTETVEKVVKETIEEVSPAEITDITPEITPEAESISEGETVEEEQPEETVKEPMEIPSEAPSEVSSEFPSETTVGITCAEPEKEIVEVETTEKVSEQPEVTTETSPPEISEIEEEVQTTISEAAETTKTESTEAPEIITEAAMETEIETEVTETPQAFPETTETEIIPEVMTTTEMPSPVTEKVTEPEVISTKIPATTPQPIPSTITPRVTYPTGPLVTETVPQSYPTTTPQPPGYETTTSRPIYTRYGPPAGMQDTCPDLLITCAFWASQGECSKNPYWMKPNCQRSCNSCGATVSSIDSPSPKPAGPSMSVSDFQDVLTIMNSASSGNHLESAYQTEHTWQATAHFHAAHVECSQFQCLVALLWLTAVETTSAKIHYIYQQYFNLADLVNLARQMSYKHTLTSLLQYKIKLIIGFKSVIMGKLLVFIAFLFPYFTCICKAVEIDFAAQEENLLLQYVKYILETYPKECAPEPGKKWFTCKVPQFWCSTLDESTEESKNASVFNHQCIQHSCLILLDNAVLPTKSVRPESSILLAKKDLDSTKPQLTFMTKNKIVDKNEESFWRNIFFGEKDLKLAAKLTGLNIAEEESLLPPLQETFILNNNKNNENSAAHVVQSDAADLINKKPVLGRENISKSTKLNETGYIDSKLLDFLFVFSDSHRNFLSKKGEINTPQCIDKHIKCLFWSLIGECDKNPFWMLPNCQKSCFSCGMTVADVNTPSPIIGPLSPEKYWKLSNPSQCGEITCEYPTFCAISKLDANKFSCEFVDDSCLTTVTFSKIQDKNRTIENIIQNKEKNFIETEISSVSQQIATQKKNYTEEAISLDALQALIGNNRKFFFENNFTQFETMDQCNDHFDACCEWALLGKCEQLPALIGIACPVSCGTCNCNKSDISTCTMEETKCRNNSEAFDYNERTKKENNTLLIIGSTSFNKEILTKISERNTTESVNAEREMNHDEVQLKEKLTEVISLSFANFSTNNNNNSNNNNTILISESERASEENSNNEISSDEISDEVISHLNKETSINKTHKIDAFRNESLSIFGETIAPTKETLLLPTESSVLGTFFKKTQQCKDKNSLCLLWAIIGECTKNPYWMKPNCQRSCNTCGMTLKDVNKELLSPDCNNQHELCQFWASINECTNNPDFMLINCAASCKSCSKLIKQN
ncbi:putative tyrosinase-like protein tyr-3 [Trichinella pseudospiralis]|uniref:Putative tyrosinase-like protein tyr-3 n=1 Tax=Trichinella pseudospiralis TaxID=6337 RepID=A0A0V1ESZ4_TRIPS|nr:putative tyrosinase-like protein tyr-3 [Trichinella pseudospiralis]